MTTDTHGGNSPFQHVFYFQLDIYEKEEKKNKKKTQQQYVDVQNDTDGPLVKKRRTPLKWV